MFRIFTNQLIKTFIPSFLLWLFGYATLFINIDHPGDRFMGAGTALLVITTLLNAISGDLPKTSYSKAIDLWFLWHILNIFAIIAFHIVLDRVCKNFKKGRYVELTQFETKADQNCFDQDGSNMIDKINKSGIIVFPFINGIFYSIYFYLTLN